MIEKTLKTTTGKLRVSIPTRLNELKLSQLMAMQAAERLSDLDAISILSGIGVEQLQNISNYEDVHQFNPYVLSLAQEIKYAYNSDKLPKTVGFTVNGTPVKVNVACQLSVEPAGAFMAAREIIAEEISNHIKLHGEENWKDNFNPSLKACSRVLAHYFYCPATKKPYDEYKAEAFNTCVEELPVTEMLPVAKYFFLSYPNLLKPKTGFWLRLQRYLNKGPALKRSKNSAISTL